MKDLKWYSGKVLSGHKIGGAIGFPTINLNPKILPSNQKPGVYASLVKYHGKTYSGGLYLGPRQVFGETKIVLEIYLLDFNKEIYGQSISFAIVRQIRGLIILNSVDELKKQMLKDVEKVKSLTSKLLSE